MNGKCYGMIFDHELRIMILPGTLTFILRAHRQWCIHLIFPWYEGTHCGALQPFKCTVHSCRGFEL